MTQTDVVMLENRVDALRSVLYRPAWERSDVVTRRIDDYMKLLTEGEVDLAIEMGRART